ncbi:MAG: hypothetical protein LBH18_03635 [Spirochaetaceae bacterium]|jgi:hypothetical protein|nr:hypothetical protein [Spirochaetaceae bacterium]
MKTFKVNIFSFIYAATCAAIFVIAGCDKIPLSYDRTGQDSQTEKKPQTPKNPANSPQTPQQPAGSPQQPPQSPPASGLPAPTAYTWYVSQGGSDAAGGQSPSEPLATVQAALSAIKTSHRGGSWPAGKSATIVISGEIKAPGQFKDSMIDISGVGNYPPIVFEGDPVAGGTLNANMRQSGDGRVMSVTNNKVTLGGNLLLTGGRALWGGAVCVGAKLPNTAGELVIAGAEISGNTGQVGGGVLVYEGSVSMTSGAIRNNSGGYTKSGASSGGGIHLNFFTFLLMSGGTIADNGNGSLSTESGGGLSIDGNAYALMTGGEIINNFAKDSGGGVNISPMGNFKMTGGLINGNKVTSGNNDVAMNRQYGSVFTQTGGTVGVISQ